MAKDLKIRGKLSDRIDELLIELMTNTSEGALNARQTSVVINNALKREGFKQRVTWQGIQDRKDKLIRKRGDLVFPEVEPSAGDPAPWPQVTIGLDPETDNIPLWTSERIDTIRSFYVRSRETFAEAKLRELWQEMLAKLSSTGVRITKSQVQNLVHHNDPEESGVDFGAWGMSKAERDALKRRVFDGTLPSAVMLPTARGFYRVLGEAFATEGIEVTSGRIRHWMTELGYEIPDYNSLKGKLARTKHAQVQLSVKARRYVTFAEVWNNKRIRVRHELQNKLRAVDGAVPSWKELWKLRDKYKRYQTNHPELQWFLPKLIIRQYDTGEPKELHPFVEEHLDEWKYDRKRIKKALGFVVGNYQWGALPNVEVIAAVKQYCEYRGFEFIVGLSQYGKIEVDRDSDELLTVLPEELRGHIVVDNVMMADFKLDCNTHLVQTSDVYLTDSVCEIAGEQSTIFLGTKQEMRHWMRLEHEYPACYMTTGSLNYPHHKRTRLGKNNKAVAVARHRHEFGFVVLEVVRDKEHGEFAIPRQLWVTEDGTLYDFDAVHGGARRFTPAGHIHRPEGVDTQKDGDLHEAGVDEEIWKITHEGEDAISTVLAPKHVHLGDTFDNKWGNPFRPLQGVRAAYQAQNYMSDIRAELDACVSRLRQLRAVLPACTETITHEPSNHSDDWLQKWINRGNLQEDPRNSPLLCELWLAVYRELEREGRSIADKDAVEEKSPFGLYIKSKLPFIECPSYQELDQVMRPALGPGVVRRVFMTHSHIGPKGKDTRSLRAMAAYNNKVAGGHEHSAARLNGSDIVGVMTSRRKHYVKNPKTNWTNSHLGIFENGFTAHIFIIHGRWYGDAVLAARKALAKKRKAKQKRAA